MHQRKKKALQQEEKQNDPESDFDENAYTPTDDELKVFQELIEMVNEEREWSGSVTDLITDLELESSGWSVQRLGILLDKAKTWLKDQGIEVEYTRPRGRSQWRFWVE